MLPFPGAAGRAARQIPAEAASARHRPPIRHGWFRCAELVRAAAQVTRALEGHHGHRCEKVRGGSLSEAVHGGAKPQRGWRWGCRTEEGRGRGREFRTTHACSDPSSRPVRSPPDRADPGHPMPPRPGGQRGWCGGAGRQGLAGRDRRGRVLHANEGARPPEPRGGRGRRRRWARPRTSRAGATRPGQTGPDWAGVAGKSEGRHRRWAVSSGRCAATAEISCGGQRRGNMASVGNGTEESGGGEEVNGGRLPGDSGHVGSERPSPAAAGKMRERAPLHRPSGSPTCSAVGAEGQAAGQDRGRPGRRSRGESWSWGKLSRQRGRRRPLPASPSFSAPFFFFLSSF